MCYHCHLILLFGTGAEQGLVAPLAMPEGTGWELTPGLYPVHKHAQEEGDSTLWFKNRRKLGLAWMSASAQASLQPGPTF